MAEHLLYGLQNKEKSLLAKGCDKEVLSFD